MKSLSMLILFTLLLSLGSCGSKKGSTHTSSSEIRTFVDIEELRAALDEQVVICGESGLACPGFAAKLTFWGEGENNSYYLGVCSGTLYNNKYIITNSHCIPHELKRAGAGCANQLKVLFPTTKYFENESAQCLRIIQVYDQDQDQPDLAVIELDRNVNRESIEIAKDAFVENANVYAYTMNPSTANKNVGTILKKTCTLSTDNAFYMSTESSSAEGVIFGNSCQVIGGNSGSALIKGGKMIGAVFARIDEPSIEKFFETNKIKYTSKVPTGIVQNIGCLRSITTNSGINCITKKATMDDLNNFVKRSIDAQGMQGIAETQIEYELTAGLKLKLKQVPLAGIDQSIQTFRDNWFKSFIDGQAKVSDRSVIANLLIK